MMPGWNLGLRFLLELAALVGWGYAGWKLTSGPIALVLAIVLPIAAATVWGTFAVPGDPSRSGKAPRPVSGMVRLALEMLVLVGGTIGFALGGARIVAAVMAVLLVVHLIFSKKRLQWLVSQPRT